MTGTAVVMPAFNERRSVRRMAEEILTRDVDRLIVVDDGSTDGSDSELAGLDLELLIHPRNLGKGFALATGMRRALDLGYCRIVTIDADGQHSPADIPRLLSRSLDHPLAVVVAARTLRRAAAPPLRRFANRVADFWISWACGRSIEDTQSGFRLYPAALLESVPIRSQAGQGFAFETGILIDLVQAGVEVRTLAIETRYEAGGRVSHYRPWRDTWSIVRLVGARLLRRGLYPLGLLRSVGFLSPIESGSGALSSAGAAHGRVHLSSGTTGIPTAAGDTSDLLR